MHEISLKGKVALITGGSRGLGLAAALAMAEAGADIIISGRKAADLETAAEQIRAGGVRCLPVAAHIARAEESRTLVEKAEQEFGRIDILVNNAGTNPHVGGLMEAEEWAWDVTMNVNLKGPFLLTQMVGAMMRRQQSGCIINVASTEGLRPAGLSIYGVSKSGLIMLTQTMAQELGKDNIRVNAVAPGTLKTRFSEALWKGRETEVAGNTLLKRLAEPEDIAGVILFLASDLANYITGETITVDGGYLLVDHTS